MRNRHTSFMAALLLPALLALLALLALAACNSAPPVAPTRRPPAPRATVVATKTAVATKPAPAPAVATPRAAATQPAPDPVPAPAVATPAPQGGDDWARVKNAGKLIVGTSADYPPFSYHTADFKIDGIDPALIREIGKRLGVEVQIKDFAFDGLQGALELGQIDTAIAAISITPERARLTGFTHPYYAGEDAILARPDYTGMSIRVPENMSNSKVGVQKGSVYETWLQNTLVDTGLMDPAALLPYADIRQAVSDLQANYLDLVMMDYIPAQEYVQSGDAKLVGRGLNKESFGIATRRGSTLLAEFDRVLDQLQEENFASTMEAKYLNIKPADLPVPVEPTATPAPTATAEPTAAAEPTATAIPTPPPCIAGSAFVANLNLDDKNMTAPPDMSPGQGFTKSWRLQNTGTCPWQPTYTMVYVQGNVPAARMNGQPLVAGYEVVVHGTFDASLNLIAPQAPGVYQGWWQMRDDAGVPFGERVYAGIQVPGAPTPLPPPPTQTPPAGTYFTADRTNVNAGDRVVFTWNVQGVKAVYFYQGGQPWQNNGVAGVASRDVYPQQTGDYILRVVMPNDQVQERQIRINVGSSPNAPNIVNLSVNPGQIRQGQCVGVDWDVQGALSYVKLWINGGVRWDGAPARGHIDDCPSGTNDVQYVLEAGGPGGVSRQERRVTINRPPANPPPQVDFLTSSTDHIHTGQCVDLSWGLSGGPADSVRLMRNGQEIANNPGSTRYTDCPDDGPIAAYLLVAGNNAGSNQRGINIQVVDQTPH